MHQENEILTKNVIDNQTIKDAAQKFYIEIDEKPLKDEVYHKRYNNFSPKSVIHHGVNYVLYRVGFFNKRKIYVCVNMETVKVSKAYENFIFSEIDSDCLGKFRLSLDASFDEKLTLVNFFKDHLQKTCEVNENYTGFINKIEKTVKINDNTYNLFRAGSVEKYTIYIGLNVMTNQLIKIVETLEFVD